MNSEEKPGDKEFLLPPLVLIGLIKKNAVGNKYLCVRNKTKNKSNNNNTNGWIIQ